VSTNGGGANSRSRSRRNSTLQFSNATYHTADKVTIRCKRSIDVSPANGRNITGYSVENSKQMTTPFEHDKS
jgi:hypothetical protein